MISTSDIEERIAARKKLLDTVERAIADEFSRAWLHRRSKVCLFLHVERLKHLAVLGELRAVLHEK
jgi:hypothetical protein